MNDLLSWQKKSKLRDFFKKIFNSYIYVLVDNGTNKILKEIQFVISHILENVVK